MRMSRGLVLLLLALVFCSVRTYGQAVATWTDSTGNYGNAANWSTLTVPNNGGGTFYNAVINGTGSDTITFDASGTTINSLSLGPGETLQDNGHAPTLTIGDPSAPTASSFTNNGTVNWSNGSTLILNLPTKGGSINNGTINVTGGSALAINGEFLNYGTVDINRSSLTGDFNNNPSGFPGGTGLLTIENGSTATLGVLGTFSAGGFVQGTIVKTGSTLSVGYLYNFQSSLSALSGSVVTIGGIDNTNGELLIDKSTMNFSAGYGSNGPTGGFVAVQNGGTLNVIGDYNNLPDGQTTITGKSVANILGSMYNDTACICVIVDNSVLNVAGDMVNTNSGSTLQNNSIAVIGGSLSDNLGLTTIDQSTLIVKGNVSNEALLTIENAATVNVLGNFSNIGDTPVMTLGGGSIVNVAGTFTNNQSAVLMMSGTNDVLNVKGSFTNAGSVTVGSLEILNANGGFTNTGGNVSISSGGALNTTNYSQSSGSTDVSGNLTSHSYMQTGGATTVEMGGKLTATTFSATGGTVTVNGNLDPTAVEIGSGALLDGTGTIIGNVAMGGTIVPGSAGAPGALTIIGNYEQIGNGVFDELISGASSNGVLDVTGTLALDQDSQLMITLLGGFNPIGDSFTIMSYTSLLGEFANGSNFVADGYDWTVTYGPNDVTLTAVTAAPEPGTLPLIGIGVLALCGCIWRKKSVAGRYNR
jgi:hypothetical protein